MSTEEIVVNVVVIGGILLMVAAVAIVKLRTTYFRIFQSWRLAERYDWHCAATPRKLRKRDLHTIWTNEGERPEQERLRIEGTHRGHEFSFAIIEFPEIGHADGRTTRQLSSEATLEVCAPGLIATDPEAELPAGFEQWLLENSYRGEIETHDDRLTTTFGGFVWRGSFVKRLDYLVDAAERWAEEA